MDQGNTSSAASVLAALAPVLIVSPFMLTFLWNSFFGEAAVEQESSLDKDSREAEDARTAAAAAAAARNEALAAADKAEGAVERVASTVIAQPKVQEKATNVPPLDREDGKEAESEAVSSAFAEEKKDDEQEAAASPVATEQEESAPEHETEAAPKQEETLEEAEGTPVVQEEEEAEAAQEEAEAAQEEAEAAQEEAEAAQEEEEEDEETEGEEAAEPEIITTAAASHFFLGQYSDNRQLPDAAYLDSPALHPVVEAFLERLRSEGPVNPPVFRGISGTFDNNDVKVYRSLYKGCFPNDPNSHDNVDFYRCQLRCRPDGVLIEEIHSLWFGKYDELEYLHGYIQWLFPIPTPGMNSASVPLQLHEMHAMRSDPIIRERIITSYELMLDFYGMRLVDRTTGELGRKEGDYQRRYQNLEQRSHNYLRITRILKFLGLMGLSHYQAPFLIHVISEMTFHNKLRVLGRSLADFWLGVVRHDGDRLALQRAILELTRS